ncbi:MAG TPA: hypothetical protein VGU20_29570 [Stellaceae bacterium]|nr:hypothetical protein [Stellaceae bacterium]
MKRLVPTGRMPLTKPLLPERETGCAPRVDELPAGKATMSGARRLASIAALLLVASIVIAGALLLAEVACPSLAATVSNPWFRSYHMGENPWAGAWAPAGASPAAPRVASPQAAAKPCPDPAAVRRAPGGTGAPAYEAKTAREAPARGRP